MDVGVDQAGEDEQPLGINDTRAGWGGKPGTDGGDGVAIDMDVLLESPL